MSNSIPFTEQAGSVDVGAHVCAIHESEDGVLNVLASTFKAGLERGERCVYVASESAIGEVRRLLEVAGLDANSLESEGKLILISDRTALLKDGERFDPDHALDIVKSLFGETLESGYAGLRLSVNVPWLVRGVPGADRALEFESKADEIINVPGTPLLAVCQYQLSDLEVEDTLEILERHPMTLVGGQVHVNESYSQRVG